jgi:hypothetical protein
MTQAERARRYRARKKQAAAPEYPFTLAERPDGSIVGPDLVTWEIGTVQTPQGERKTVYFPEERPYAAFYREALSPAEIKAIIADLSAELERRKAAA